MPHCGSSRNYTAIRCKVRSVELLFSCLVVACTVWTRLGVREPTTIIIGVRLSKTDSWFQLGA